VSTGEHAVRTSRAASVALAITLLATPAAAEVYTWVDEQGTIHFQEDPPPSGRRAKKLALPVDGPTSEARPAGGAALEGGSPGKAPASEAAKPQPTVARPKSARTVELYTTSWCPHCKSARAWFDSRGIAYVEHDIEKDAGALSRRVGLGGGKSIPVAVIDGTVVMGYSPSGYEAAVGRR
jgi:glutaredoxin